MKNEKLLNKIRKMLTMAERSEGNEEQAAVAAAMVQNLMAKHNLTIADIGIKEAKSNVDGQAFTGMKWTPSRCPAWVQHLSIKVAAAFDCIVRYVPAQGNDSHVRAAQMRLEFVGVDIDSTVAVAMFEYLYETTIRLSNEHDYGLTSSVRVAKNNFRHGMATRLSERLETITKETKPTGTGLVVVKRDAIDQFLGKSDHYTTKTRSQGRNDAARSAGYTKGGSVSFKKQVK